MGAAADQRAERISAMRPVLANPVYRPAPIVNSVVGLNGGNHPLFGEARDGGGANMLGVFYAETPVARPVAFGDRFENIKHVVIGAVANRMDGDMQSRLVSIRNGL